MVKILEKEIKEITLKEYNEIDEFNFKFAGYIKGKFLVVDYDGKIILEINKTKVTLYSNPFKNIFYLISIEKEIFRKFEKKLQKR